MDLIKKESTNFPNDNRNDDVERQNMPLLIKADHDHHQVTRLREQREPEDKKNVVQRAIRQTFQSTTHLANLLPTGTVLAFQLLAPIFTNLGQCDQVSRLMTTALVSLRAASAFLVSFTDSFKDKSGNVCYRFATLTGLLVIDGSAKLLMEEAGKYRLRFFYLVRTFMSVLVFLATALS